MFFYYYVILSLALVCTMMASTGKSETLCYQCNSSSDMECSEFFDSRNTHLRPTPCTDVYQARYCIKTTGIYGGLMGTQRFCSSRHIGNQCDYIKRSGDEREQRSCVFTCSGDGCNSAPHSIFLSPMLIASILFLGVWLFPNYSTQ